MTSMRAARIFLAIRFSLVLIVAALPLRMASSQEGFPLDGTWRGLWGNDPDKRATIVLIMKWDGETINGMINPGPNSLGFSNATLDPATWGVSLDVVSAEGEQLSLHGTLTEIGSYHRKIVGTWTQGGTTSPIELTRE